MPVSTALNGRFLVAPSVRIGSAVASHTQNRNVRSRCIAAVHEIRTTGRIGPISVYRKRCRQAARAVLLRYNGPLHGLCCSRTLIATMLPHHFLERRLPAQQFANRANILDLAVCH